MLIILLNAILLWQAQQVHKPRFVSTGTTFPYCSDAEMKFDGCYGYRSYTDPGHWECGEGYKPSGVTVVWSEDSPDPIYQPKECIADTDVQKEK